MEARRQRPRGAGSHARKSHPVSKRRASLDEAEQLHVVIFLTRVVTVVSPYTDAVYATITRVWDMLEDHHAQDLLVALCGFALCFFGGVFMTVCFWEPQLLKRKLVGACG